VVPRSRHPQALRGARRRHMDARPDAVHERHAPDLLRSALRRSADEGPRVGHQSRPRGGRDHRAVRFAEHPRPGDPGTWFADYGHAEGTARFNHDPRKYCILPKGFVGDEKGNLKAMRVADLDWSVDAQSGKLRGQEVPGSERDLPADLVFLSIGFTGHDTPTLIEKLGVETQWGAVSAEYGEFKTNVDKVFVAGDMRRGASLIVWAIAEGRGAARAIDLQLMGQSQLPAPGVDTGMLSSAG